MRTYVKIQRIVEDEKVENVFCDWCGVEMGTHSLYDGKYVLTAITGSESYPDCGWENGWQIEDLCDPCVERLRQLLVDNGVKIKKIDESW